MKSVQGRDRRGSSPETEPSGCDGRPSVDPSSGRGEPHGWEVGGGPCSLPRPGPAPCPAHKRHLACILRMSGLCIGWSGVGTSLWTWESTGTRVTCTPQSEQGNKDLTRAGAGHRGSQGSGAFTQAQVWVGWRPGLPCPHEGGRAQHQGGGGSTLSPEPGTVASSGSGYWDGAPGWPWKQRGGE